MANVLKKLSAFVPTIEDTVGNLDALPAATTAPVVAEQAGYPSAVDSALVPNSAPHLAAASEGEPASAAQKGKTNPRSNAGQRRQDVGGFVTLRNKDGGIDGRSLNRSGRVASLALRLKPELTDAMKLAAYHEGITLGELTERMWAAYTARRQGQGGGR